MKRFVPVAIICAAIAIFFYKTFLFGHLPFPGDLLISEYRPWRNYSFLGYNPGSYPHKAQYFDVLRQLYPWRSLSVHLLKEGKLPLWNPYNFSGSPLLANFQSAALYPLNILFFFFPDPLAWSILVVVQPTLALVFLYLYCRKIRLSPPASWLSALSYAFGSFMTVWIEYNTIGHVVAWLPLLLLAIEGIREQTVTKWWAILAIGLTFSLLAGHPQLAFYAFLFTAIYAWFRLPALKQSAKVLVFMILSIGVAAVQLIPGIELILYSARTPLDVNEILNKVLIQPWQLIMLLVQDLFGNPATRSYWPSDTYVGKVTNIGLIPLIFVCLLLFQKLDRLAKFFLVASGVILIFITRNPATELVYRLNLPILSSGSPTLVVFLFQLSLALAAGFGLDAWMKNRLKVASVLTAGTPLVVITTLLWIVVATGPKLLQINPLLITSTILVTSIFLLLLWSKKPKYAPVILGMLLLVHVVQLWQSFQKFNPFVPKELVFPLVPILKTIREKTGIDRFWSFGSATIEANFPTQYRIFSAEGYDPLYPRWYGEFIHASDDGRLLERFSRDTRSDARLAPTDGGDLAVNHYRLRILNLLGTRFLLDHVENNNSEKTIPPSQFTVTEGSSGWILYKNINALPRAFLSGKYETYQSKEEFSHRFFDPSFSPKDTILLSSVIEKPVEPGTRKDVKVSHYSPTKVDIETEDVAPQLLFLSDSFYPGWKATIDGTQTPILRADFAFRAVYVPAGKHSIFFIYDPLSVKIGKVVTLVSIVITLIVLRKLRYKRNA